MRIDHDKCGSKVDHDTLTVKTFITVQENLGIFTHSTRRYALQIPDETIQLTKYTITYILLQIRSSVHLPTGHVDGTGKLFGSR